MLSSPRLVDDPHDGELDKRVVAERQEGLDAVEDADRSASGDPHRLAGRVHPDLVRLGTARRERLSGHDETDEATVLGRLVRHAQREFVFGEDREGGDSRYVRACKSTPY